MLQLLSKYIKIETISEEQDFAKLVLLCLQLPVLFALFIFCGGNVTRVVI